MAAVRLSISGMTCDHCRNRVEDALKRLPGVYAVIVDLEDAQAEVDFDERKTGEQAMLEAVQVAGYGAEVAN